MSGFTIKCTTTGASESVTLPLVTGYNYNCTVDWDDGAPVSVTAWDDANATHVYVTPGTYTVEITGTCEAWSVNNTHSSKLQWTEIVSFGDTGDFDELITLLGGFYGCTNLTGSVPSLSANTLLTSLFATFRNCTGLTGSIPSLSSNTALTSLSRFFLGCTGLTGSIPSLSSNTALTDLSYAFNSCTGLTGDIPSLASNTLLTNFTSAFNNCPGLKLSPWMFYSDGEQSTRFLNKSINFSNCFYRASCTADQGQAPDLWNCDFGTGTPTKTNCFAGAGNFLTSLVNYNNIPSDWGGSGYVDTPPDITSVDASIYNGKEITLIGTGFEASGGALYVCDTNDLSDATKVLQNIDSQSDTEIVSTISGISGNGIKYLYFIDSDDQISDSPAEVFSEYRSLVIGNNGSLSDAYSGTIKKISLCNRKLSEPEIRAINIGMLADRDF